MTRSFVFFVAQVRNFFPKKMAQYVEVQKYLHQNQFQPQKYLHQSRSETSKDYIESSFEMAFIGEKLKF